MPPMEIQRSTSVQAIASRSLGGLFHEAAVLIGVFGSLDPVLRGNRFQLSWTAIVAGVTSALFLLGLYFTVMAEKTT
jgi:hypothetical protein